MTKYLLTDWEINGYNDSDFMCTYYDDSTKEVKSHTYGTTRFAAPTMIGWNNNVSSVDIDDEVCLMPTREVVESARVWLEEYIFNRMVAADKLLVDSPDVENLHEGLSVRLTADCRYQLTTSEPCIKCSGSGNWVNPKNAADKRECFSCKGTGLHITGKLKDANGKLVYEKLAAGTFGSVVDWKSFGQFYANGYNKPNRQNTTVQFKLLSGKIVRASLEKLRLNREYLSIEELRASARKQSYSYEFSKIYPRSAWDTHNFAREVAKTPIEAFYLNIVRGNSP
jgi:hypothetical protein